MATEKWSWKSDRCIPSDADAGRAVIDEVLEQLKLQHWIDNDIFAIHLALDEALVNAIKHGNQHDRTKHVRIQCHVSHECVRIEVADEGTGFKPDAVPDCTCEDRLEVPSGRGIMLMRSFMSHVQYNDQGNCVVMEKKRANGTR